MLVELWPAPRRLLGGGLAGGLALQEVEEEVVGDDEPSPLVPLDAVRPLEEPTLFGKTKTRKHEMLAATYCCNVCNDD